MKEGIDYVTCKICGKRFKELPSHLRHIHKINGTEYKNRFPGSRLTISREGEKNNNYNGAKERKLKRFDNKTENIDYVTCQICGLKGDITAKKYKEVYNVSTVCKNMSDIARETMTTTNKKYPDQATEAARKLGLIIKKNDPDQFSRMGKRTQELYPDHSRKNAEKTQRLYPGLSSRTLKATNKKYPWMKKQAGKRLSNFHKEFKENDPDGYFKFFSDAGKKGGQASFEINRKNQPYMWQNVHFMSKLELECAKLLLTEPLDGVNCNIKINRKTIDFFPQITDKTHIGCFVEFHPWDIELTLEEYEVKRQDAIKNSDFCDIPLIVITNFDEIGGD